MSREKCTPEELEERRRLARAKGNETQKEQRRLKEEAFRADYEHFRSYGMTEEQIALRLGYTPHGLRDKTNKLGIPPAMGPEDRMFYATLERLISRGKPFSTDDLPVTEAKWAARDAIRKVASEGRIVPVGSGRSPFHGGKISYWQAAPAELDQTA